MTVIDSTQLLYGVGHESIFDSQPAFIWGVSFGTASTSCYLNGHSSNGDGAGYIYSNVGVEATPDSKATGYAYSNVGVEAIPDSKATGYIYSDVSDLVTNLTVGFNKQCYIYGSAPGGTVDALGLS